MHPQEQDGEWTSSNHRKEFPAAVTGSIGFLVAAGVVGYLVSPIVLYTVWPDCPYDLDYVFAPLEWLYDHFPPYAWLIDQFF